MNEITLAGHMHLCSPSAMHNAGQWDRARGATIIDYVDCTIARRLGRMRQQAGVLFAIVLSLLGLEARATEHIYSVTVDKSLSTLWVEAQFATPITKVSARSRDAGEYLLEANHCSDESDISVSGRRMRLAEDPCIRYSVDIGKAARDNRQNRTLAKDNIVLSPSVWLWRPELNRDSTIDLRFDLPEGMDVSVPWQSVDRGEHVYRIIPSPESSNAPVAFGKFASREIDVPGAALRVTIMNAVGDMNTDAIVAWLQATATDASLAYGRFPNPAAQIVVYPVGKSRGRGDSAVPFGRVIRDGGESVELFVNETRSLSEYLDDWTATHEFSHLMVPFVGRRHRWISEGFAQYYQNVLLARAGAYVPQYAWQKIYDGLERGRKSSPRLSPNQAARNGIRNSLMKVYWSGAALALMADVSLRERSGGAASLDSVLDGLQSCCLPSDRAWSGEEFFAALDAQAGEPIFTELYARYANEPGFPSTHDVFDRLGIDVIDDEVHLRRGAELEHLREAIMQIEPTTAEWRRSLAAD